MTGPDLLAGRERALRSLELSVKRKLEGFLHGEITGLRSGPGSEPNEARPYQAGQDDVRRMDWNVTARSLEPHVRAPLAERELETWALVDASASMDFGTALSEKRDLAVAIVGAVGLLADRPGNRLGVRIALGNEVRRIPDAGGPAAMRRTLRALLSLPRATPGEHPQTDLTHAITRLNREHPRPGLRVVISDFHSSPWPDTAEGIRTSPAPAAAGASARRTSHAPAVGWADALRRLGARHEVIAVEVLDPRELELPEVGLLTLVDPETGRRREVQTSKKRLRERYAAAMTEHREQTAQAIRAAGAAHLVLRTDTDWVRDVAAFATARRRAHTRRNPRGRTGIQMKFEQPLWLWLLLIVAALVVAYVFAQRRRSKYAVRFATLPMLEKVAPTRPGWRRHAPAFAFLAAMIVLTIAIARPVADVRVPRERATVVVAMDISNSMAATDVEPNRFEVAKSAATEFVNSLPEQFNVGLVSFARTANVVTPPSTDHQATVDAIGRLTLTDSTAIGEAVLTSLQAVRSLDPDAATDPPPTRIVLLSDGGNTSGRPIEEAAEAATQAGVPVSTIAYGTPEGTVDIDGRNIPVPADAESLRGLADATSGSFYSAESDEELRSVYSDLQSSIGWTTEEREITNLVAGVALAVALLAGLASLLWFSRLP